ncbi:double-strand break repair helicase AddA [Tropicimonas sp. IMCC34043]|uniref:double-strand break repair helicase AddA n=1 Tax=Tropicimonas sp. IMCC34043 TaxID=2248760 RepID=UPI000E260F43|nr:double-strand break repair helicase AddA [Tropicimonas sp. IMCC34043]
MTAPLFDEATRRQVQAADPAASTWLTANAGSGKTRVLTDRVARLLLGGVPPQNVLCLTYTKAAAAEMQNRLFGRLGEWAMLDDDVLRAELQKLGAGTGLAAETLAQARRLFARAIETPGGLKIQTIHSFCAGLLRRFPLEAGVSPGFTELDEIAAARLRTEVLDHLAETEPGIYGGMAALVSDPDLTGLAAQISSHRNLFPARPTRDDVLSLYDLPAGFAATDAMAGLDAACDPGTLGMIADTLAGQSKTMVELAQELRLLATVGLDAAGFGTLARKLLYASGENIGWPKPSALTKKAREALGPLEDDFDALADAVAETRQGLLALAAVEKTLTLHRFAAAFLPAYATAKEAGGWLDFDDQIQKAEKLLSNPGVADWVLYRLDGSIDHVLVDEAQDTSPLQWQVIEHLTREFTAGGSRATAGERSIFVVGDLKQSIYSFQGADPEGFVRMRQAFASRLGHLDLTLQQLDLQYSFRSAGEVLKTVDATFGPDNLRGMGDAVGHVAFKGALPGRVDLWPLVDRVPAAEPENWEDPVDLVSEEHHVVQLAQAVARQVREMVDHGFLWAERNGAFTPRPIHEGDVLILVQGRGEGSAVSLFHEIIRACKAERLSVAGADVLKLGEELAVRDVRALLAFLATPEDDLSLAAALRSPLLGLSEAQLFDLAAGRPKGRFLWEAMRRRQADFPQVFEILSDLRDQADFLRPYDLIERLLMRHDGRRRLVARLGEEASDGIDALLAQALAYEQDEPPSLTGFLARMEGAEINVKRRAEARGSKLRVMTVHGAKGLESPIVILPDTAHRKRPHEFRDALLPSGSGVPQWNVPSAEAPEVTTRLKRATIDKRLEEAQRLLYVAMTRAEQWLIVAAAGDLGKDGDSWYQQVEAGMQGLGASAHEFALGPGLRLESPHWATARRPAPEDTATDEPPALPGWALTPAETPDRPAATLSPSGLGGAKALPGERADWSEAEALRRGTLIHLLLEHLPAHPRADWPDAAAGLLATQAQPAEISPLLTEARRVLEDEALAFLFAPETLAEVPVTAALPELGGARIHGAIDRLLIRPDHVLAVDFKTNALVPDRPEAVPIGLLRQMGAYAAALKLVFPDRRIDTAILWTAEARLMALPAALTHEAVMGMAAP